MSDKIFAGIVTFNPDIDKLKANMDAASRQVDRVIVVDNGSENISVVENLCDSYAIATLIKIGENKGIAAALNITFKYASVRGAKWVLTLDQDSCIYPDFIENCRTLMGCDKIVSITTLEKDRNCDFDVMYDKTADAEEVGYAITSGNLVMVDAWSEVCGFNESLFIDSVDFEFSYRLREAGYSIYRINKVLISHELGDSRKYRFLWKQPVSYNHNPFRKYYIFRNGVYQIRFVPLSRERHLRRSMLKNLIKIILYEEQKKEKLKAGIKGIIDGFRMQEYVYKPIDLSAFNAFACGEHKVIDLPEALRGGQRLSSSLCILLSIPSVSDREALAA